jgi:outer membrane protein assembly factor BamD (BamD/ComL family)
LAAAKVNGAPSAITPASTAASRPVPLEPAPLEKTIITTSSFDLGEMNFQIGNYGQAAKFYQTFLNTYPKSKDRDRALYHMGLACALDSNRDLRQTEAAFKKLVSEFPNSPYKSEAEFILNQQMQIEKLRVEVKERE